MIWSLESRGRNGLEIVVRNEETIKPTFKLVVCWVTKNSKWFESSGIAVFSEGGQVAVSTGKKGILEARIWIP